MASLKIPELVPSATEDSQQLRKALVGLGTDEARIIQILGHRNAAQRKLIRETYQATYEKDLLKDLDGELSGDFQRVIHLWTMDPAERDACLANEATKHLPDSNCIIMEIACARSSNDLFKLRQTYHSCYKKSLEEDVYDNSTGDFRKVMVRSVYTLPSSDPTMWDNTRYEGDEVNMSLASNEAKILHEKISDNAYSDEEIIRILSIRSKTQLNATFNQYNDQFGNAINKDLKSNPKDAYMKLLRSTIQCLTEPEKYFEKVLRLAMKGMGTDEESLTRIIATRAEVDMELIKERYYQRNSMPLDRAISDDTSGDYERMLLALIGRGDL